jgi:hypothetical protein
MWVVSAKLLGYVTFSWWWCVVPIGSIFIVALLAKLFVKLIELGQKAAQDKISQGLK